MTLSALLPTRKPWFWSFAAAFAAWGMLVLFLQGRGADEAVTASLAFAAFFVIVGLGQMMVITLGPGNIDLSIPATITLAAVVAMRVMGGEDANIPLGVLAALGCGVAVGLFNNVLIHLLRMPPIIATLSASFLIQSAAISYGRGLQVRPPQALQDFATARLYGVPVNAVCAVLLAAVVGVVLARTVYGRSVLAVGQNPRAAWLAGVRVGLVRSATYVLCAVFAALCGVLLAGFSGGASLDMGQEYLLASIAVVVIGGCSVAGGRANVPGIWGASLFLFLLVSMLNSMGLGAGFRLVLTGLIIIAVITLAGGEPAQR
ncbi:ABC transporter permease [Azospirillum sp. SYSU D00513]|uniref:ABC transporter permease n=1 Tax=Azospirillum sp. SYSU D00513 TaxID=2812561 RepID=UPI001A97C921|nr:ABC transporter permease [Azospirillum sp. SYSU D00513]